MATAAPTATATATDAPAPAKGKKKLIIIIAVAVLVLAGGGGAAMVLLKKKPAVAEGEEAEPAAHAVAHDPKAVPVFVPLDPFTVNLADREAERYAQVGITLEITDAKVGDQIKAFMPAIRNNILMTIADRTALDMANREGKLLLAEKIRREASRAMGVEIDDAEPEAEAGAGAEDTPKKKKGKKKAAQVLPIKAVHFSNFIIQ